MVWAKLTVALGVVLVLLAAGAMVGQAWRMRPLPAPPAFHAHIGNESGHRHETVWL